MFWGLLRQMKCLYALVSFKTSDSSNEMGGLGR